MSEIKVDTVAEKTSANGVTVDGLNIKDSKLVTANSVVTSNVTDANITSGKIADDAITLAKMASGTDGNIISYDASGNPVAIATGNDGQVLTSTGAGSPPAFEALPGGGKVLQVVQGTDTSSRSSSSTNYVTGTINASITPSATGSKVLVHITGTMRNGTFNIYRASTDLGGGQGFGQTNGDEVISAIHYLDSPSTTSATTYTGYMKASNGGTVYFGRGGYTVITLMEIGV